ncbi:mutS protein homolog 5 [Lingula anatina]|uniref:MutS protein homolog 5 n=1 Tax=Lingula anatina TaxID=7574 RepID=A0A1S3IM19_LINAN|nr:mutS protein homolog 5 [Lingula anatina]XP_013398575.1 mutS protein homolog 5 [Lingula anatina]|eukprot:XP_013398574.1 mutS protein homolog 5 [Lingula anatina]
MSKSKLSTTKSSVDITTQSTSCSPSAEDDSFSDTDITVRNEAREDIFSEEFEQQIYLSIVWNAGKLGVAYYDVDTTQIYLMLDCRETDDFQILNKVLSQVLPTCIITSSKQDDRLLKVLQEKYQGEDNDEKDSNVLQFLPSADFTLEVCKRRLLTVNLPGIPDHFDESQKTLYLSSLVPMDCTNMVRATGALLKYLEKCRVGVELEGADVRVPVLALKTFSLDDMMIIDDNTYCALQIFQKELHPSVYKSGSWNSAKEGLSLFGIVNKCKSRIGSMMLRLWFLRPLKDINTLRQRQDAVAFFFNPRNIEINNSLQDCLKHINNTPKILNRMKQAQASIGDWQALYKTIYNAIHIGDICRAQADKIDIFEKISTAFTEDLHRIAILISKIVDFDESFAQNRFVVKPNVDPTLDEKKKTYNGLPDFMTTVAQEELSKLSEDILECNVIYLPQLGYLLAIPKSKFLEEKEYQVPGLDFMFFSNDTSYFKSARTRELDHLLGDTQCDITDHETSIMHRLQNTILEHCKVLLDIMDLTAHLDCLLALATCAREYNYVRPELTTENIIVIQSGRHPLQELCCSPFVPNATMSGGDHGKMKVLTGPNASGKSVYLKQVALITFLAHIGSYVPAESARIGLLDRIFSRIKTMESVSVGLSTFMIDLNQVSAAINNATQNSLIILDEFGKGTETTDGLALLCSCLKHWLALGSSCPHVLVSTHFHGLIQHRLLPNSQQLKFQTMDIVQNETELVFLYQLIDGSTNCSQACHIAAQAGLPKEIVSRGLEVSELLRKGEPVHRQNTSITLALYRRCENVVNKFLQLDLEKENLKAFLQEFVIPASIDLN